MWREVRGAGRPACLGNRHSQAGVGLVGEQRGGEVAILARWQCPEQLGKKVAGQLEVPVTLVLLKRPADSDGATVLIHISDLDVSSSETRGPHSSMTSSGSTYSEPTVFGHALDVFSQRRRDVWLTLLRQVHAGALLLLRRTDPRLARSFVTHQTATGCATERAKHCRAPRQPDVSAAL